MLSQAGAWDAVHHPEQVGPYRKNRAELARASRHPRGTICDEELLEPAERFDALPLVPRCDARVQCASRLAGTGAGGGLLGEHAGDAHELACVLARRLLLEAGQRFGELSPERLHSVEAGW